HLFSSRLRLPAFPTRRSSDLAGLLVPISVYQGLGISDEAYHMMALSAGGIAGLSTLIGAFILMVRRFRVKRVRATSSVGDRMARSEEHTSGLQSRYGDITR